jgi:ferritin
MLSQTLVTAINEQFTQERQNAVAYEALSWALISASWDGFGEWMRHAAHDERKHAAILADHLIDRNAIVIIDNLQAVQSGDAKNPTMAFGEALRLEVANTEALRTLYFLCEGEEDPQACVMLQPLLDEQTKSERELKDIITQLQACDANGWIVLDHRMGKQA